MRHKTRVLVLAADYSHPDGRIMLHYIHTRNLYYMQHDIDVTVINFRAEQRYVLDGIEVLTLEDYRKTPEEYDILVCHAPNIRNHYLFLKRYQQRFKRILFFFHGHEVIRLNSYPKPYSYVSQSSSLKRLMRNAYDTLKLSLWRKYLPKLAPKSQFVFVSDWMQQEFYRFTRIKPETLCGHCYMIHNVVGQVFETHSYNGAGPKEYDFITIRSDIDGSTYAVDIVNLLAQSNPNLRFLVVGKGNFFRHVPKAENLTWIEGTLPHGQMLEWLNRSRCALMPTRHDTQGLMSCEFATYGLPLITSDIKVCQEMFDGFTNVALISNNDTSLDLGNIVEKLCAGVPYEKNPRFFAENTVLKEIALIHGETF